MEVGGTDVEVGLGGVGVGVAIAVTGVGIGVGGTDVGLAMAEPSGNTVMVAVIVVGWNRQKYGKVPTSVNVKEKESPGAIGLLSQMSVNPPVAPEVEVCSTGSSFVQVTLVPTVIVRSTWEVLFISAATSSVGATVGIGASVAVGFGVAVGKVIPKDLNEPDGVGTGERGAAATAVAAEGADAPDAAVSAPESEPPPQAEAANATAMDTKIRVVLTALVMSSSLLKKLI